MYPSRSQKDVKQQEGLKNIDFFSLARQRIYMANSIQHIEPDDGCQKGKKGKTE